MLSGCQLKKQVAKDEALLSTEVKEEVIQEVKNDVQHEIKEKGEREQIMQHIEEIHGKYYTISEVIDAGPYISKIVLDLEQEVTGSIDLETFQVYVTRKTIPKEATSESKIIEEGNRTIMEAYVSDAQGNRADAASYITLIMEVQPRLSIGSIINYAGNYNHTIEVLHTIYQIKDLDMGSTVLQNKVFNDNGGNNILLADDFTYGISSNKTLPLKYAEFRPKNDGKNPLIIWLHGAGEGGENHLLPIIGNKVVNLASEDIQSYFGGAYVLVPQASTMWMDNGKGMYTSDGSSKYTEALKDLVDEYLATHEGIDQERIYIGGCSNGGFMTMKMILTYPDFFTAAFPVCDAYADAWITEEQIRSIKDLPIWFTHAQNDEILKPIIYSEGTYLRLVKAGATNVHISLFDEVVDTTGQYVDAAGAPYKYMGHFSWVYALDNQCILDYDQKPVFANGKEVTLMEWLSKIQE